MNPHRVIPVCLVLALAVSWFAQSDDLFKVSLVGLGLYLLWIAPGFVLNALSWLQDRLERLPGGWHFVIPASLAPVIAASWFAGSKLVMWAGLMGLAYYVIWRVVAAAQKSLYERKRRRELADMPEFSLQGGAITMVPHGAAEQAKPLDELDRVLIQTTDQGPFVCDRFLLLSFHDDAVWNVQADNPCYGAFYGALSEALPLDQEKALLAALSTDNCLLALWERNNSAQHF